MQSDQSHDKQRNSSKQDTIVSDAEKHRLNVRGFQVGLATLVLSLGLQLYIRWDAQPFMVCQVNSTSGTSYAVRIANIGTTGTGSILVNASEKAISGSAPFSIQIKPALNLKATYYPPGAFYVLDVDRLPWSHPFRRESYAAYAADFRVPDLLPGQSTLFYIKVDTAQDWNRTRLFLVTTKGQMQAVDLQHALPG